jgi:hypothetical protein
VQFDSGVTREAAAFVAERKAWPDPERKLRQARGSPDFAGQITESGDYGAALEQTRGALSLVGRSAEELSAIAHARGIVDAGRAAGRQAAA